MTGALPLSLALLAAAAQAAVPPWPAGGPTLLDLEIATDDFQQCYEPKLARDPLIVSPITERAPFEGMDNSVSNAAFARCKKHLEKRNDWLLRTIPVDPRASQVDWLRTSGLRIVHQRNAFYHSRGAIDLSARRQMRPYLKCVSDHSLRNQANPEFARSEPAEKTRFVHTACSALRYSFEGAGSRVERVNWLAQRYQDIFLEEAIAFALEGKVAI
jgi:hypothetical protein